MWGWEREKREAKKPRDSGTYLCPIATRHGRVYVSRPIHSAFPASNSVLATLKPQVAHYALTLSSAPLARGISRDSLSSPVYVSMPVGDSIVVDRVYRLCLVVLGGFETRVDLLFLSIVDFDVILGIDWLSPHHVILDCHAKMMTLPMPGLPRLEWKGTLDYVPRKVVPFLKAQQMVRKGCEAYLAFVRDVSVNTPTAESVPVVRDYPNIFSVDLLGMPPEGITVDS
ncbi:uncharacterized protein [Nicotiana tomentosiformis]|uniref:uncharacterized protein n=1 Tax=Nicotiana tomentosiformis TaxID=4098 RepID=UPI00388C6224